MKLSLAHIRTHSLSSVSGSSSMSAFSSSGSPTTPLSAVGSITHHAHLPRRRSSAPFLRRASTRHRWLIFSALLTMTIIFLSKRTVPFLVLGSTYLVSSSYPAPVLGKGDHFDLVNLAPAPERSVEVVPRLIHQVRLGGLAMRPAWEEARSSCLALHPPEAGWEFKLWEDAEGDAFVKTEYPHLFDLYLGYDQEIMRSNVLRYLVLHKYGGVYLDLDLRCRVALDPFLGEDFITPPAQPIGVNNAFIVAKPDHDFFAFIIDHLPKYNMAWFGSAYASNMFSTGCHFFSSMHLWYSGHADLKVLPWDYRLNGKVTTPLFEHLGASSWHKGDAAFILSLGQTIERWKPYLAPLAAIALLAFASTLYGLVWLRRRLVRWLHARKGGLVESRDADDLENADEKVLSTMG